MRNSAQDVTIGSSLVEIPGDRTAVTSGNTTLRYSEFDAAVNHIAEALHHKGIKHEECVAVIVPRSPELVVAIHGIMRAGAAYVPIDPEYPVLRIRAIMTECGARVAFVAAPEYCSNWQRNSASD